MTRPQFIRLSIIAVLGAAIAAFYLQSDESPGEDSRASDSRTETQGKQNQASDKSNHRKHPEERIAALEEALRANDASDEEIRKILLNLSVLLEDWMLHDPAGATAWIEQLIRESSDQGPRHKIRAGIIDIKTSDYFLHAALRGATAGLARNDPEKAVQLAKRFQKADPDSPDSGSIDIKIDAGLDLLHYSLARLISSGRRSEALTFINALPPNSNASALAYHLAAEWGKNDPKAFSGLVNEHPAHFEDSTWEGINFEKLSYAGFVKSDPEWVMTQPNGIELFGSWVEADSDAARSWLGKQAGDPKFDSARITAYRELTSKFADRKGHLQERLDFLNQIVNQKKTTFYRKELITEWKKVSPETVPAQE